MIIFSGVIIFQGWIFFRGEYFPGVNISQGWIFFRCEYFSGVNIFQGWLLFMGEYLSGLNIFSGVNIFQWWIFWDGGHELGGHRCQTRTWWTQRWMFYRGDHFSEVHVHRPILCCAVCCPSYPCRSSHALSAVLPTFNFYILCICILVSSIVYISVISIDSQTLLTAANLFYW